MCLVQELSYAFIMTLCCLCVDVNLTNYPLPRAHLAMVNLYSKQQCVSSTKRLGFGFTWGVKTDLLCSTSAFANVVTLCVTPTMWTLTACHT